MSDGKLALPVPIPVRGAEDPEVGMLTLGEVHTGLLQNSGAISARDTERVLTVLLGARVRRWERPIAYAVSPHLLTGVDCRLPTRSGARSRAVGTAASRAMITGGHVLQASTRVRLVQGESTRRLPWSYYLSRPGTVQTIGRVERGDLVPGFLAARPPAGTLDLGAISGRMMDSVQRTAGLDRRPPFRAARTRLRWLAGPVDPAGGSEVAVRFTIHDENLRTVRLGATADEPDRVAELAEDLALHDWLLSTVLRIVERTRFGAEPGTRVVQRLRPAIDHLLHLWMPAARLDHSMTGVWESLERHPGFTRQWNASVARIRDQVAVTTLALFGSGIGRGVGSGTGSGVGSGVDPAQGRDPLRGPSPGRPPGEVAGG